MGKRIVLGAESFLESFGHLVRHRQRMKYTISAGMALTLFLVSCSPYQQQGAAVGGVAGGALGAIAGGDSNSTLKGAAIGAGLGVGIASMQEQNRRNSAQNQQSYDRYGNPKPQPNLGTPGGSDYPYAEPTSTRGEVLSPYTPYNVIDVRGLRSGSLAKDPSCGKIFRIP